jgi:CarD family transcriptional regulator
MAQKMAPSKVASKKAANKKPTARKDSHSRIKTAKAKAAIAAQAPKRTAKAAVAKPAPQKTAAAVKSAPHAKAPSHKAATVKEAVKTAVKAPSAKAPAKAAHAAPTKHETVSKAAAPKAAPMPPAVAARPAPTGIARSMPAAVTKTASQKIIAPAAQSAAAPPAAAQPAAAPTPPPVATSQPAAATQPAAAAAAAAKNKAVQHKLGFKVNEWIVYPAHGVGRVVAIEEQEIAGIALELFVITFEKDKMTLRVPTGKSASVGMRKLAEEATVKKAIETLKGRARVKRTMWSRRAQEYEAKINSGDLIAIAEVVRDLYRSESQPEQSYSERQLYEAALDRMAREIAVVEKLDERGAVQRITEVLAKSARGRGVAAEAA